jgi:hypothetical protein
MDNMPATGSESMIFRKRRKAGVQNERQNPGARRKGKENLGKRFLALSFWLLASDS